MLSVYQEDGLVVGLAEPEFLQFLWGHICEVGTPVTIAVSLSTKIKKTATLITRTYCPSRVRCPVGLSAKPVYSRLFGKGLDFPEIRSPAMFTT